MVKEPVEHQDSDHGGTDEDGIAEEVPPDSGKRVPETALLNLHLGEVGCVL